MDLCSLVQLISPIRQQNRNLCLISAHRISPLVLPDYKSSTLTQLKRCFCFLVLSHLQSDQIWDTQFSSPKDRNICMYSYTERHSTIVTQT